MGYRYNFMNFNKLLGKRQKGDPETDTGRKKDLIRETTRVTNRPKIMCLSTGILHLHLFWLSTVVLNGLLLRFFTPQIFCLFLTEISLRTSKT